jgi:hypothetical protein
MQAASIIPKPRSRTRVALSVGVFAVVLAAGSLGTAVASGLKLPAERTSPTGNFFTLEQYTAPSSAAKPVAEFKMKVCTSAHTPAGTAIAPSLFTLSLTSGGPVSESTSAATRPALVPTPLKPLQCVTGWLGFKLAKGSSVSAVDKTVSKLEYEYNGKISWDVG